MISGGIQTMFSVSYIHPLDSATIAPCHVVSVQQRPDSHNIVILAPGDVQPFVFERRRRD